MKQITYDNFENVEFRVGEVLTVETLANARKPAYVLHIDFGKDIGVLKSSTQITDAYSAEDIIGKQVVAVLNLPKKQIGKIMSECLVTGFDDALGRVILCVPDRPVPLGTRLY